MLPFPIQLRKSTIFCLGGSMSMFSLISTFEETLNILDTYPEGFFIAITLLCTVPKVVPNGFNPLTYIIAPSHFSSLQ